MDVIYEQGTVLDTDCTEGNLIELLAAVHTPPVGDTGYRPKQAHHHSALKQLVSTGRHTARLVAGWHNNSL
jgi:hypothetical protein